MRDRLLLIVGALLPLVPVALLAWAGGTWAEVEHPAVGAVIPIQRWPHWPQDAVYALLLYWLLGLSGALFLLLSRRVAPEVTRRQRLWKSAPGLLAVLGVLLLLAHDYPPKPLSNALFLLVFAAPVSWLTLGFAWSYTQVRRPKGFREWASTWLLSIMLLASPLLLASLAFVGEWVETASRHVPRDGTYYVLRHVAGDIVDGSERYLLTKEVGRGRLSRFVRVLGESYGTDPDAVLTRPARLGPYRLIGVRGREYFRVKENRRNGKLVLSPGGHTLVFAYASGDWEQPGMGAAAKFVYNLKHGAFREGEELKTLSPFLLLGPDDKPYGPDIDYLKWRAAHPSQCPEVMVGEEWWTAGPDTAPHVRALLAELEAPASTKSRSGGD